MAYLLNQASDGAYFDLGSSADFLLWSNLPMSMGGWINLGASVQDGDFILRRTNNFFGLEPFQMIVTGPSRNGTNGWGIQGDDLLPSSVNCVGGAIDPKYIWQPGSWRFFGFSRFPGTPGHWFSYFGSRSLMVAGQSSSFTSPGGGGVDGGGSLRIGWGSGLSGLPHGVYLGPFSIWKRGLTISEWQSLAQCTAPTDGGDMLLFSKMNTQPVPTDVSTYGRHFNTPSGIPQYLADQGCAQFSSADNYTARVS